jgi:hypothetical protein
MSESQDEHAAYASKIRKMPLTKFVLAYFEAMSIKLRGQSAWQYEICHIEDERRGGKAHPKAIAKLNETFNIKAEGNVIDLRESSL